MSPVIKVIKAISSLNKAQVLKALELTFNEEGLKDMYNYYAVGGLQSDDDFDTKVECDGYLKIIKEAKKLTK